MDALNRQIATSRVVLAEGPTAEVFTVLAVLVAIYCVVVGDPEIRQGYEVAIGLPVVLRLIGAGRRLNLLALNSGVLGIPGHASHLRQVQWLLLAVFLVLPMLLGLKFGMDLRALVVPVAVAAVAVALSCFDWFWLVVLTGFFAAKFLPVHFLGQAFEPIGAALLLGVSAAIFRHWFAQPKRLQELSSVTSVGLADSAHEQGRKDLDVAHARFEQHLGLALSAEPPGELSARRFWLGMGHDPRGSWRATAYAFTIAAVVLAVAHWLWPGAGATAFHLIVSGIVALAIFGRFMNLHEAWTNSPEEQSVLLLAPGWPTGRQLKITFLRCSWTGVPAYLTCWLVLSAGAWAMGWVNGRGVIMTGIALLIVAKSSLGLLAYYLSQPRQRKHSFPVISYLVSVLVGVGMLALGMAERSTLTILIALAVVFLPTALALYRFATRPLQFPSRPLPKPPQ